MTGRRANQLRYWAFPRTEELYVCSSPLSWQQTPFDALSNKNKAETSFLPSAPNGVRTRVTAVKGRCPRPLDDGDLRQEAKSIGSLAYGKTEAIREVKAYSPLFDAPFNGHRDRDILLAEVNSGRTRIHFRCRHHDWVRRRGRRFIQRCNR